VVAGNVRSGNLDWFDIWDNTVWPEHDDEFTFEQPEVPVRIMRKSFELSKLPNQASVESAVKEFKRVLSDSLERLTTVPSPHNDRPPTSI
jgi:hypothetical protein